MTRRDHHTSTPSAAASWEHHRAAEQENTDTPDVGPDDLVQGRPIRGDLGDWQGALDASLAEVRALRGDAA